MASTTILSLQDFAKLTIIIATLYTGINIFANAFQITTTTYCANRINPDKSKACITSISLWAIAFGAIASTSLLAWMELSNIRLTPLEYSIGIIWGVLHIVLACLLGEAQGLRRSTRLANALVLNAVTLIITSIFLIEACGSTGFLIALAVSTIITLGYLCFTLQKKAASECLPKINSEIKSLIAKVTLPSILAALVSLPAIWYPLQSLQSMGLTLELALYGIALQIKNIATLIPVFFGGALLPWLARNSSRKTANEADFLLSYGLPFIIIFPFLTNPEMAIKPFNNGFGAADERSVEYMLAAALVICYKAPIGRELVVSMLGKLSSYSNASWLLMYIFFLLIDTSEVSASSYSKALFFSTTVHLLMWLPYYLKNGILQSHQLFSSLPLLSASSVITHFLNLHTTVPYLVVLSWVLYALSCAALISMVLKMIKSNEANHS